MSGGDWTRWNRAGRARFEYVGQNAATLLEGLRLENLRRFTAPGSGDPQWSDLAELLAPLPGETPVESQARLLRQYRAERRDFGWEILRALSRSLHVLAGHVNAYANESYLETATQWESLRKLVAMLHYRPAPPASASATLVLLAKEGKSAVLPPGLAVKNAPTDGTAPLVFETRAEVALDWRLNALRPLDWNRSQLGFDYAATGGPRDRYRASFPLADDADPAAAGITAKARGVLVVDRDGEEPLGFSVEVESLHENKLVLLGQAPGVDNPFPAKRYQVRLLLDPLFVRTPQLSGDNTIAVSAGHGLTKEAVVAWQESGAWKAARVDAVDGNRLSLSGPDGIPAEGKILRRAQRAERQLQPVKNLAAATVVPLDRDAPIVWKDQLGSASLTTYSDSGFSVFEYSLADHVLFYLSKSTVTPAPITVTSGAPQHLSFPGDPGKLTQGSWVVSAAGAHTGLATQVTAIRRDDEGFVLDLDDTVTEKQTLYGDFSLELRPRHHDRNTAPIVRPGEKSDQYTTLHLEAGDWTEAMAKGRKVVIQDGERAWAAKVASVDPANHLIRVAPPIPGSEINPPADREAMDFRSWNTTVAANAVDAGHGESKPEKNLGSGDAARSDQRFHLAVDDLAFVADPVFPSGVRADLELQADSRIWRQVSDLADSGPEDPDYQVSLREDGTVDVIFGDGRTGRRLPTGRGNVRVRYRVGNGLAGNLPAGGLIKPAKPHPALDKVQQPLPAAGGNDREEQDSLRLNAPPSVLALERAVSLADFGHLAARYSGVWQAHAFRGASAGKSEAVTVAVVPAGGGPLGSLEKDLRDYLLAHTLPGVSVTVLSYQGMAIHLDVSIQVDNLAFDPEEVGDQVRAALLDALSLSRRKLGQPLFNSDVTAVVENVAGVENSTCRILAAPFLAADGTPKVPHLAASGDAVAAARANDLQVFFLDPETSVLTITPSEFAL